MLRREILLNAFVCRYWDSLPAVLRRMIFVFFFHPCSPVSIFCPDRVEVLKVKRGVARGMKMRLNPKTERKFLWGTHESKVQAVLGKFVTPGMTAYNLGAHIGFFTLALMNLVRPGGRVLAFEPNPRVRDRLIDNLSLNGDGNRVRVENWALTDFDGQADFSLGHSSDQGRFGDLPFANLREVIAVGCRRLDTYVEEGAPPPDFILMDVEHAEGRVLRGMRKILERYRPILLLEMHGLESIQEAWTELKSHEYKLAGVPGLKGINSLHGVGYGHCLATPLNFTERDSKGSNFPAARSALC